MKKTLFATVSICALLVLGVGAAGASTPTAFANGFETDTSGWLGAITRVASGTDGVPAATGSYYAQAADDSVFTRWGGYSDTFPANGYSTALDVYLNVAGGYANDTRFDWDSSISTPSGGFQRDFIFNCGYYNNSDATGSGPRFVCSASNNSSPGSADPENPARGPFTITTSGWYTFVHHFYDSGGGVLAVDLSIENSAGTVLHTWTLSDPSDIIGSTIGGNHYGWIDDQAFPFLAIDNSVLTMPCTTVCYVNGTTGNDAYGGDTPATAKKTIQAAVNQVSSGGEVIVAAGSYPENVVLSKSLTLDGAQATVDARGRSASETIIDPTSGSGINLEGGSANSTIAGFTFSGPGFQLESTSGPIDNLTVENNRFEVQAGGVGMFLNDKGTDVTIDQNSFDGGGANVTLLHLDTDPFNGIWITNNWLKNSGGTGLFSDGARNVNPSGDRSPKLEGNLFDSNETGANLGRKSWSDASITGNTFTNNLLGLQGGMASSTIGGNTFDGNGLWGLELTSLGGGADATSGAQYDLIRNNTFTNNGNAPDGYANLGPAAIFYSSSQYPGTISTNVAKKNNITGNAAGVVYSGSETINVECNWWGSLSGPSGDGPGSGDSVVGSTFNYAPWLSSAAPGGACNAPTPTVNSVSASPQYGNSGTTVNLSSEATDPTGLTAVYYNLFTPGGTFVCNLAHATITGDPTSTTNTTTVSEPLPFPDLYTGVGGPHCAGVLGIPEGNYVIAANWIDAVGNQVGDPNNHVLANYPASARFSPFVYDNTDPTITVTTPVDGAVYLQGSTIDAGFTCSDAGGSGVATCVGTVASGSPIDTSNGAHTFTVTATDRAGNTATTTVSYIAAAQLAPGTTNCDGYYDGTGANVNVPTGAVCHLLPGTEVTNNVTVQTGGTLIDEGATVDHDLKANNPTAIEVTNGATVIHDLVVQGATSGVTITDSTIGHDVVVQNSTSTSPVTIENNNVTHDLRVKSNLGGVVVDDNQVGHDLVVQSNSPTTEVKYNTALHNAVCQSNSNPDYYNNNAGTGDINTCTDTTP